MKCIKPERIWLRENSELDERWVQMRLAEDPEILGLGDLVLRDKERMQPSSGRLDLLFQDPDTYRRYEVEVQLWSTDESHIIRTIEYWDIERKHYPQYEHCAVIVAEDITSRFLNVISLFNGFIPLIAIQMSVHKMEDQVALIFTKVLDELPLGLVEEYEEVQEPADRVYWEDKATKKTVAWADRILEIIRDFAPEFELQYNKYYIGLVKNDRPNYFAVFRPRKSSLLLEIRLERSDEIGELINDADLEMMDYNRRTGRYRVRLTESEIDEHKDLITNLLKKAYEENVV